MRLRKQLLLLSLLTLSLPWVGCQYIREMDQSLRNAQVASLEATAKAVAASIENTDEVITILSHFASPEFKETFYAHTLQNIPAMDGYGDDWLASEGLEFRPLPLIETHINQPSKTQPEIDYIAGIYGERLYLFLSVKDTQVEYYNPTLPDAFSSDHLTLTLGSDSRLRSFIALASAPGNMSIHPLNSGKLSVRKVEPQIKGIFRETVRGYQVEFSLPHRWASKNISLSINNSSSKASGHSAAAFSTDYLPLVTQSEKIEKSLSIFVQPGIQLQIASQRHALAARVGSTIPVSSTQRLHGFADWLYSLALGDKHYPKIDTPQKTGFFTTPEVATAQAGKTGIGWYEKGATTIVRVAYPITTLPTRGKRSSTVGSIVIEQSAESLSETTNAAFNRLVIYSFIATTGTALGFVIYATWLSIRIRKLSFAASNAITDSGKVADDFPVFDSLDEVGDLSRSYAQLLARLKEYTNYLRTLSSKLSHELRTPLAIVRSSLDNLEHEKLPAQARTYAERAKEGTTRLSNILNSMSAASRVEQAISSAEMEEIPCNELLSQLKGAYEGAFPNVDFSLNIQTSNQGFKLYASGELLVQLLDKLVDNAADFCPEDGVIELGLYRTQSHIVFTVRNDGPPLPSHMQGQLFDSMVSVRGKAEAKEEGHHLGLGLYIVRLITDFHQGEVQGYNIPDMSGVIFEVKLPITHKK